MAFLPLLILIYARTDEYSNEVSAASETFIATRSCSGVRLCADDLPSASIDSDRLLSQLNSSFSSCVPAAVLCSRECSRDPDCTNFNYKQDPDRCELFHYTPANCSTTVGCTNMEINGTNGCQKPVRVSCAPGFHYSPQANSCYKVVYGAMPWKIANRECQRLHHESHLVEIKDEVEQDAVEKFLDAELRNSELETYGGCVFAKSNAPTNGSIAWIGGQTLNLSTCDPFVWKLPCGQTAPMNYTNWSVGSPSCVIASNEHCVHIWQALNYTWNDLACSKQFCGLCEYDLT